MRGHRSLRDSKSLSRIGDIQRALTIQPLDIQQKVSSKHIFGVNLAQAEIASRQYLLAHVAGLRLNRSLLYAFGKPGSSVAHFLPPEWRKVIRNQGVKVAPFQAALIWQGFVAMMLAYGVLTIAKIIVSGIEAKGNRSTQHLGRYAYFDNLALGNLPQPCRDGRSHDIISWYMQWPGRVRDINTVCHGVIGSGERTVNGTPIVGVPGPIPALKGFGSLARFISWGILASLIAACDVLRGRWWHALLLNQAALAAQVRVHRLRYSRRVLHSRHC